MLRAGLWHRGIQRLLTLKETPQPGKEFVLEFPQGPEGVQYELLNFLAICTASAAVGNRNATFHLDNGSERYARWGCPNTFIATATVEFVHFPGADTAININPVRRGEIGAMPSLRVPPGHRITSETGALDVADQWSGVRVLVQEWVYEDAGERVPAIGDGSGRVDTVAIDKLNATLAKLAELFESQTATP